MKTKDGMMSRLIFPLTPHHQFLLFYLVIAILCPDYANGAASLCPSGWEINPNKTDCYIHIPTSHSWEDSYSLCTTLHNSYLPEPNLTSTDELLYLGHLCRPAQPSHNHSHACWLGNRFLNVPHLRTVHTYSDSCVLVTQNSTTTLSAKCNTSHEVICVLPIASRCHRRHCHKEYFIILLSVSGLILGTTLAVVIWLLVFRRNKRRKRSRKTSNPSTSALVTPSWKVFTNEELRSITKNFSEGNRLIGDAKTGGTYSGLLPDVSRVAVKRLRRSSFQRKKEFYSAIGRVARLHHPNLVAIKGCRYDHGDRYIVYEFVANGPLDRWLHHIPRGGRSLDWSMRMTVATTLAQGIAFLHDKVKPHVVHQDIRASNVLLDEDFGAHLMGVGLSKFVPWEVMHERTVMAATYGYLAPEFVYRNELTTKSDVYSFGVLLLEIVSGRRPTQSVDSVGGWQTIFEWATPLVQSHCYLDLLDPLISDLPELGVVQKVVELVYSCTQHVPSVRPRMSHVVHQLQQLGLKSTSEKTRSGTSTGTNTSTATPLSIMEIEVNNV